MIPWHLQLLEVGCFALTLSIGSRATGDGTVYISERHGGVTSRNSFKGCRPDGTIMALLLISALLLSLVVAVQVVVVGALVVGAMYDAPPAAALVAAVLIVVLAVGEKICAAPAAVWVMAVAVLVVILLPALPAREAA